MARASTARKKKTSKKSKRSSSKKKATSRGRTGLKRNKTSRKKSKKGKTTARSRARSKKKPSRKKAAKKTRKKVTRTARKKVAKKRATKKQAAKKKVLKRKATKKKGAKKRAAKKKVLKRKATKKKGAKKQAARAKKQATPKAAKKTGKTASKPAPPAEPPAPPPPPQPSYDEILASLPYQEGSFVVHPKYGLGKVDRIVERTLSTGAVPCMEIGFPHQEMKLTIPVDQVSRSGLREPIGKRDISGVFKVLKGRATFDAKRRSAKRVVDYRKRLSLGDPTSLAEAVRDLARLSLRKSLSYEERKILSTAMRILSREVALARGREPDDVREEIEKIVYR